MNSKKLFLYARAGFPRKFAAHEQVARQDYCCYDNKRRHHRAAAKVPTPDEKDTYAQIARLKILYFLSCLCFGEGVRIFSPETVNKKVFLQAGLISTGKFLRRAGNS